MTLMVSLLFPPLHSCSADKKKELTCTFHQTKMLKLREISAAYWDWSDVSSGCLGFEIKRAQYL